MVFKSESNIFVGIQLKIVLTRVIKSRYNETVSIMKNTARSSKFSRCYTYLVLPSGEYECITDVASFTDSPDGRTTCTQVIHCFMMPNYADIFAIVTN